MSRIGVIASTSLRSFKDFTLKIFTRLGIAKVFRINAVRNGTVQ
jgi:hypothetical protein